MRLWSESLTLSPHSRLLNISTNFQPSGCWWVTLLVNDVIDYTLVIAFFNFRQGTLRSNIKNKFCKLIWNSGYFATLNFWENTRFARLSRFYFGTFYFETFMIQFVTLKNFCFQRLCITALSEIFTLRTIYSFGILYNSITLFSWWKINFEIIVHDKILSPI